jgi:hypothetical protein
MGILCHLIPPSNLGITKPATLFSFSYDDRLLLTSHDNEGVLIWDLTLVRPAQKLAADRVECGTFGPVKAAAFSPRKSRDLVLVFGLGHPTEHYELSADGLFTLSTSYSNWPEARDVKYSPDGNLIAFAVSDMIKIWDTKSECQIRTLIGSGADIVKVAFADDSKYIVAVDIRGRLFKWETEGGSLLHSAADLETTWNYTEIAINPRGWAVGMISSKEISPKAYAWRLTRWYPLLEAPENEPVDHMVPKDRWQCAHLCLAPNAEFATGVTEQGDLIAASMFGAASTWKRMGKDGKRGRAVSCGMSPSSHLVAFSKANGSTAVHVMETPVFGCAGA